MSTGEEKTLAKIQAAPLEMGEHGIKMKTMEEAFRFANMVIQSGLAPKSFVNAQAVLVCMQYGAEIGLKPMQALQNMYVVNGRPALWGKALPGIVQASGQLEGFKERIDGEGDKMVAVCWARRKGGVERESKFSVDDAKKAALWGKDIWAKYPKDMLAGKARARCLGILFADRLCGIPVVEDIQEVPPEPRRFSAPTEPLKNAAPDPLFEEMKEPAVQREPGDETEQVDLSFDGPIPE